MRVVILAGGRGIRAFPFTQYLPKPMMPVGGSPILLQVMRCYIEQGYDEFVVAAGHQRAALEDYFEGKRFGGTVQIVDTGEDADTGERIRRCREHVGDTFMATYADGLCDVDIEALLAFHRAHAGTVTITAVPLISQYGTIGSDASGKIETFTEKPVLRDHWINAGFMVFDQGAFDNWRGASLEREVVPHLASRSEAYMYRHDGFFKSMDSFKDQQEFEALLHHGNVPWRVRREGPETGQRPVPPQTGQRSAPPRQVCQ